MSHAVEAAASIAQLSFVQPGCRAKSGRVELCFSNAADLADFDDSLYAHVSAQEVDGYISDHVIRDHVIRDLVGGDYVYCDHVIDVHTIGLADEIFAMNAVLGPAGSTIAQDLRLGGIGEFFLKDDL